MLNYTIDCLPRRNSPKTQALSFQHMNKVLFKDAFARDNSSPEDEQCFIFENDKFRECSCTNVMITSSIESPCRRFIDLWKGKLVVMKDIPNNQHITYQLQFRKCGKASCSTCRDGQGHGPYWYAYWRVRDPGCGQVMWGKFIPTSKSHQLPQEKMKLWQQNSPQKSI